MSLSLFVYLLGIGMAMVAFLVGVEDLGRPAMVDKVLLEVKLVVD